MGDSPVVAFLRLLCTVDARGSHCSQSSGCIAVMSWRYCSIHWFFLSDSLSVCRWKADDRFCWIPSFFIRAVPKWDVKWGSRLLIILSESPDHRYTFSRYSWVIPGPVIEVLQGKNTAALKQPWSIMVRIASIPFHSGRPVIKSMVMAWKGRVLGLVGIQYRGVHFRCVRFLLYWQIVHPLT